MMTTSVATKLDIFLSHKCEDAVAAATIQKHLQLYGNGEIRIFLSEDLKPGTKWRNELIGSLANADCVLLLYTGSQQDWSWCLYECGFFDGQHFGKRTKPLIVLHHADTTPSSALSEFEWVSISADDRRDLTKFLKTILAEPFHDRHVAIQPQFMSSDFDEERQRLEDAIIEAVCPLRDSRNFERAISIVIEEKDLKANLGRHVPPNSRVFGNADGFALAGLPSEARKVSWDVFAKGLEKNSDNTGDWSEALGNLFHRIAFCPYKLDSTGLPLYRYNDGTRVAIFRPMIRTFTRKRDALTFSVVFADLPLETTAEPPSRFNSLAQALTISRMFRWGVITPLDELLSHLERRRLPEKQPSNMLADDVAFEIRMFRDRMQTIYVEAFNRGYNRQELLGCFEAGDQAILLSLFKSWDSFQTAMKELLINIEQGKDNLADAKELVASAYAMNKQFIVLCARKYHELLEREL
jgi:hypothetical protein